jgi:hypothetical protein
MGIDDNPARGGLSEDLRQAHHRYGPRFDDVGQDLSGSHGGQLIDVDCGGKAHEKALEVYPPNASSTLFALALVTRRITQTYVRPWCASLRSFP